MIHKIFYAENQNISFNLPEQGSIGILLSGGADSSLLCYLLADTIVKNNLKTKIHPITAEMLLRPYCVTHASNVLKFISEKTGFHFENHLCFSVPNHNANLSEEARDKIYTKYTDDFAHRYQLQTVFHGNTANPPVSLVPDTVSSRRPNKRDDLAWRKSQEDTPGLSVPFIHIDKKEIAQIYKKYNLIESLLPLTRSCEGELEESSYFKKDCFSFREPGKECWWCREREYGFSDFDFKNNQNASAPSLQEGGTDLHKLDVYRIKEKIPILNEQYVEFNIPIAGSVGCDVSGGVDSALTCYLLAHTIMKYKLKTKVYPITGEILSRPYNLRFATNILNFITSTTGFKFSHHLSYFVPDHLENADQKELDRIEDFSINEFIYKYNLQTIFSGNIANPSTEKMPTSLYPDRPINRDNQDWKNSQLSNPNLEVPFINFDKKIIASLYKKFDLLDTLLPLTRSCESSPKESAFFTYDCFQTRVTESSLDKPCWGCQERAYGFRDIKRRTFLTEKIYYSENEFITLDIPEDGLIGCSMSGGSDSSLLCFLLAKTIKKYGFKNKNSSYYS